jgi:hypothetical protein
MEYFIYGTVPLTYIALRRFILAITNTEAMHSALYLQVRAELAPE